MGLGGTAKKLQKVADSAEELYKRLNELREQIQALRIQVETTGNRVESMEGDLAQQRVLLEALAEKEGIDVDELLAKDTIEEAEEAQTETPPETPAETTD